MNVNNTGFEIAKKKRNYTQHFVTPQGYTQCVLVSNTECEHNFGMFPRKLGTFKLRQEKRNKITFYQKCNYCVFPWGARWEWKQFFNTTTVLSAIPESR